MNICFHSRYEKISSKYQVEQIINNETSKKAHFKSEINKVSTNKGCQFLEYIVPIKETSDHNSNGYRNVDFVFTLDLTNASFICGIKVIF